MISWTGLVRTRSRRITLPGRTPRRVYILLKREDCGQVSGWNVATKRTNSIHYRPSRCQLAKLVRHLILVQTIPGSSPGLAASFYFPPDSILSYSARVPIQVQRSPSSMNSARGGSQGSGLSGFMIGDRTIHECVQLPPPRRHVQIARPTVQRRDSSSTLETCDDRHQKEASPLP